MRKPAATGAMGRGRCGGLFQKYVEDPLSEALYSRREYKDPRRVADCCRWRKVLSFRPVGEATPVVH